MAASPLALGPKRIWRVLPRIGHHPQAWEGSTQHLLRWCPVLADSLSDGDPYYVFGDFVNPFVDLDLALKILE